jgi:hypothetical protein
MRSSEREVGAASVRGAAHVAHGVPSDRAGQDICKQSAVPAYSRLRMVRKWSGYVTPLVLFPPGSFMTMAQGISLPYPQAALVHDR